MPHRNLINGDSSLLSQFFPHVGSVFCAEQHPQLPKYLFYFFNFYSHLSQENSMNSSSTWYTSCPSFKLIKF